jgi:gluconate 2-dehydrogenase gamma chain
MNRRLFLTYTQQSLSVITLSSCHPAIENENNKKEKKQVIFSDDEKKHLVTVQAHLFPKDDDGPSAKDIHAFHYLEKALLDKSNIKEGDPSFICKGVSWLKDLSMQEYKASFLTLSEKNQNQLLMTISHSEVGERWLSLLIYYIIEALLLDPIYGGNPNSIGWKWIEHQAGYPRPTQKTRYDHFE